MEEHFAIVTNKPTEKRRMIFFSGIAGFTGKLHDDKENEQNSDSENYIAGKVY